MDAKLMIKLEKDVAEKAKMYARLQKVSLSKLIESYLRRLTNEPAESEEITPFVKSLSGIIKLPEDHDPKKAYAEYLEVKYK